MPLTPTDSDSGCLRILPGVTEMLQTAGRVGGGGREATFTD